MKKNNLIISLLFLGLTGPLFGQKKAIHDLVEESFSFVYTQEDDGQEKKAEPIVIEMKDGIPDLSKFDFSMPKLSAYEARSLFLNDYVTHNENHGLQNFTLLDKEAIDKLHIISGTKEHRDAHLSATLPTKTVVGDVHSALYLCQPLSSYSQIAERQRVVKALAHNKEAQELVTSGLEKIASGEQCLGLFLRPDNKMEEIALGQVYYGGLLSFVNKNITLMTLSDILGHGSVLLTTATPFGYAYMYALKGKIQEQAFAKNPFIQKDPLAGLCYKNQGATYAVGAAFSGFLGYIAFRQKALIYKMKMLLQEKLCGVARVVDGLHDINRACKICPELKEYRLLSDDIAQLLDNPSTDVQLLLKRLASKTFASGSSAASFFPRVLVTYKQLEEHKELFAKALHVAGKIDAFSAAAQLVETKSEGCACYTFAQFRQENNRPFIFAQSFWNSLMAQDKAVVNSLALGDVRPHELIISGPNGSGKSVLMAALINNIVLSHTFGIAAARSYETTVFNFVNVYKNVQEDLQDDMSTFMAEARCMRQLRRKAEQLTEGQLSITLIDEGLKGTTQQQGSKLLSDMVNVLADCDRSITIMATHLQEPTEVASQMPEKCKNIHLGVERLDNCEFERTFKVKDGVNKRWFNDELWASDFVDWLQAKVA